METEAGRWAACQDFLPPGSHQNLGVSPHTQETRGAACEDWTLPSTLPTLVPDWALQQLLPLCCLAYEPLFSYLPISLLFHVPFLFPPLA